MSGRRGEVAAAPVFLRLLFKRVEKNRIRLNMGTYVRSVASDSVLSE